MSTAGTLSMINDAWRKALIELDCHRQVVMDKMVINYVSVNSSDPWRRIADVRQLRSIHSRTRGHLVAECKSTITKVYGISHLSQTEMADQVEYLLDDDRFTCRQATRDVSNQYPCHYVKDLTPLQRKEGRFRAEEIVVIEDQAQPAEHDDVCVCLDGDTR